MFRKFGVALLLAVTMAMPVQQASAQDPLVGGLLGGAAGAIIGGGITGRGQGAAVGAIIGATAGAIIAAEGQRRSGNYYAWRQGCWLQRADGGWIRVASRYCAPVAYVPPAVVPGDAVAYCAQRYRSYDPVSQTYLGFDGLRHPCP
jgi:hypothetical protein